MNITASIDKLVINIPQRKLFDVCLELNKLAFPIGRYDDAVFYLRPNMLIHQQDFDTIFSEDGHAFSNSQRGIISELVFYPTTADLFKQTHGTVNQLTETLTSGWFAYTNVRSGDEFSDFIKGNGATPWFALADAWIQVQKLKTQNDLKASEIPNEN